MAEFYCVIKDMTLSLNGAINVDSLGDIIANNKVSFAEPISVVDCAKVTVADSSFLAFLLYLQTLNNGIKYINIPKHLLLLIELYDLNSILNTYKT